MSNFKQAIKVTDHATDILKLDCVYSCHKEGNDFHFVYLLYDWDEYGQYIKAEIGDWLCEDNKGKWHKLTNEEYGEL